MVKMPRNNLYKGTHQRRLNYVEKDAVSYEISFAYVSLPCNSFASVYFAISRVKFLFCFEAKTNKTNPFFASKQNKIRFIFALNKKRMANPNSDV